MNEPWYEVVAPGAILTQGDLIFNCPLLTWSAEPLSESTHGSDPANLKEGVTAFTADVVVMTQACDLEHGKVRNVVLCPHDPLSVFRKTWDEGIRALGHNPSEKAWRKTCDDIANGRLTAPRIRLLPPYREHLSQAFARFFMRVGLPQSLAKNW